MSRNLKLVATLIYGLWIKNKHKSDFTTVGRLNQLKNKGFQIQQKFFSRPRYKENMRCIHE